MLIYVDTFGAKNRPGESASKVLSTRINMHVWFDYRNIQFLTDHDCQEAFSITGMQSQKKFRPPVNSRPSEQSRRNYRKVDRDIWKHFNRSDSSLIRPIACFRFCIMIQINRVYMDKL